MRWFYLLKDWLKNVLDGLNGGLSGRTVMFQVVIAGNLTVQ